MAETVQYARVQKGRPINAPRRRYTYMRLMALLVVVVLLVVGFLHIRTRAKILQVSRLIDSGARGMAIPPERWNLAWHLSSDRIQSTKFATKGIVVVSTIVMNHQVAADDLEITDLHVEGNDLCFSVDVRNASEFRMIVPEFALAVDKREMGWRRLEYEYDPAVLNRGEILLPNERTTVYFRFPLQRPFEPVDIRINSQYEILRFHIEHIPMLLATLRDNPDREIWTAFVAVQRPETDYEGDGIDLESFLDQVAEWERENAPDGEPE